eukprot:14309450-Alexandrium_andersonii.AAC.1
MAPDPNLLGKQLVKQDANGETTSAKEGACLSDAAVTPTGPQTSGPGQRPKSPPRNCNAPPESRRPSRRGPCRRREGTQSTLTQRLSKGVQPTSDADWPKVQIAVD